MCTAIGRAVRPDSVGHRVADGERRAHGPLGIVAVGHRRAEHPHDAVADVLVDGAAVLLDQPVGDREEAVEQVVHLLRVQLLRERGVAGKVGEEHRHLAPLAGGSSAGMGPAAGTASVAARRSVAVALSSRFLSPNATPSSFSSASVRSGSTSRPTALAAKSSTYFSSPRPRSQASTSTPLPLVGSS